MTPKNEQWKHGIGGVEMTLDEAIKHAIDKSRIDGDACNINCIECKAEHKKLAEWLQELKERRESSLRPATKFLTNTIGQQLSHIHQEFKEVELELGYGCLGIDKAVEELIDLQTACETMLDILGLGEIQRMEARRKVIKKNQARGYYCESSDIKG